MTQFLYHLDVVFHTLLDALGTHGVAHLVEKVYLLQQVVLDIVDGFLLLLLSGDEEVGRVNLVILKGSHAVITHGVHLLDTVHLVVPECHAHHVIAVGHEDVHGVALHTECATLQVDVVAHVESVYEPAQQHVTRQYLSLVQMYHTL